MLQSNIHPTICVCLLLAITATGCTETKSQFAYDEQSVAATLDSLHNKASSADFEGYFDLYAQNAVFHGTDATERWSRTDFMEYARPHFDRGNGWTYAPTSRHIYFSSDGETAWFDELLENSGLGVTRGTGVLELQDDVWRFAQYNLTIPIPNELAGQVVSQIRANDQ